MTRYARQPIKSEWWEESPMKPALTVFEPSCEPRQTGLLDKDGWPIVAFEERDPIGFIRWQGE